MEERYPIGKFTLQGEITSSTLQEWINEIENLPALLRDAVSHLNQEQLDTPYRSGGWTVRQVVHHLADSHMNAYIRFKLALTEDNPGITPYKEAKWAELSDSALPVEISLSLLEALHLRWVELLRSLTSEDLKKTFIRPDTGKVSLEKNVGIYAWHGRHHLAHITNVCKRNGW